MKKRAFKPQNSSLWSLIKKKFWYTDHLTLIFELFPLEYKLGKPKKKNAFLI